MRGRTVKPAVWEKLLAALTEGLPIHEACKKADVGYATQWWHRKDDPEFAKRFDEAMEVGRSNLLASLEAEADRRGKEGVLRPVYQGGKKVGQTREYSDSLLMFRMKKLDPSYRDRLSAELTGANGAALPAAAPTVIILPSNGRDPTPGSTG